MKRASAQSSGFRRVAFPPERRLVLDTLHLGRNKPMMHGLFELDVTRARRLLREHRQTSGESLSFTAFVLSCIGRAVARHPEVHALRDWTGKVVVFEDVDATTIVEVEVDGRPFPLAHVLRAINRRSLRDLHEELRSVQSSGVRSLPKAARLGMRLLLSTPGFVRRPLYGAALRFPHLARRHTGTLLVSAVGMFSEGASGWGLSAPGLHNLSIIIGGIARRPAADAAEAPRQVLCLTVSANHALVDGAPLARFARDLSRRVSDAEGLDEAISAAAAQVG